MEIDTIRTLKHDVGKKYLKKKIKKTTIVVLIGPKNSSWKSWRETDANYISLAYKNFQESTAT